MSKELTLQILKEYYFQGDDYLCGEKNDYYQVSYSNDYPMQHGYGIEIRYYKTTNKISIIRGNFANKERK